MGKSVIVIGASAGGTDALIRLISQLPGNLPASVFVVLHMAADASAEPLLRGMNQAGALPCSRAKADEIFKQSHVYLAPSDHHLLVKKRTVLVTKGARENRSRPGIDPLFRSAAVAHGSRVIGVLLTGNLSDGTAGMLAIKRCGGVCVVQDPEDAAYPDMPRAALDNVAVDHSVPLAGMGALLSQLVAQRPGKAIAIPEDVAIEARIAERVLSDLGSVDALGDQVPFNCPNCGGVLWQIEVGKFLRFRCHTGHAYTGDTLLAEQSSRIEETLWVALRMFEERKNLLNAMSDPRSRKFVKSAASRAKESDVHIQRIRAMLISSEKSTGKTSTSR